METQTTGNTLQLGFIAPCRATFGMISQGRRRCLFLISFHQLTLFGLKPIILVINNIYDYNNEH